MTGGNLSWPSCNHRHANPTFPGSSFHPAQAASASAIPWTVVAREDHQCFLIETELFDFLQYSTHAAIHFQHGVPVKSVTAGFVNFLGSGQRFVGHGVGEVEEEWFLLVRLDKLQRASGVLFS